jgi:hypothetical protein
MRKGFVLAAIAGSVHWTSFASPPVIRLRTVEPFFTGASSGASISVLADTSVKGDGDGSTASASSAENMKLAVCVRAVDFIVETPHGWAVKAVATARMVNRVKRRNMVKGDIVRYRVLDFCLGVVVEVVVSLAVKDAENANLLWRRTLCILNLKD